jgi:regulator-associated protein of mTOR
VGLGTSQHHPPHSIKASDEHAWRIQDRVKTVAVGGVMCLHLGVDPPDILKTSPCARLECWVDPSNINKPHGMEGVGGGGATAAKAHHPHQSGNASEEAMGEGRGAGPSPKAKEVIGRALIGQYEYWQPRARYKLALDPTAEDVRKLCGSLRKAAKEERALLHWNGHGTPRPTRAGEVWVFNRGFTQYIPVGAGEVLGWLGLPCTWVVDCSGAGHVLDGLLAAASGGAGPAVPEDGRLLVLAACRGDEVLPMDPALPADLFTACLTTPLEAALLFHRLKSSMAAMPAPARPVPGRLGDRKTPLGLLGWAFTALTDTMAWSLLPREQFKLLFRQDILTASLSRNFLLAARVLAAWSCTPLCWPPLRVTSGQVHTHRLWAVWDHLVDEALSGAWAARPPTFFPDQLDAFEAWIAHHRAMLGGHHSPCPSAAVAGLPQLQPQPQSCEHLPMVLQVLLSQAHRPRALELLGRFFALGPWAAADALDVGLFPYILKLLLQAPAADPLIRPGLLALWLQVLLHDPSTAKDLASAKEQPFRYFCRLLLGEDGDAPGRGSRRDTVPAAERQMAALCLAAFVEGGAEGGAEHRKLVLASHPEMIAGLLTASPDAAESPTAHWALLGALLGGAVEAKVRLLPHLGALHAALRAALGSADPWARAAVCFLAGRMITSGGGEDLPQALLDFEQDSCLLLLSSLLGDPSLQVRLQLAVALSRFVAKHFNKVAMAAYDLWEHARAHAPQARPAPHPLASGDVVRNPGVFTAVWRGVLVLALDPAEGIARLAAGIVDEVHLSFLFPPAAGPGAAGAAREVLFVEDRRFWRTEPAGTPSPPAAGDLPMAVGDESNVSIPVPVASPPSALTADPSARILLPPPPPPPSTFIRDLAQHRLGGGRGACERRAVLLQREAQRRRQVDESSRLPIGEDGARLFDRQLALLSNGATPSRLAFDPFRDLVIVADTRNRVRYPSAVIDDLPLIHLFGFPI